MTPDVLPPRDPVRPAAASESSFDVQPWASVVLLKAAPIAFALSVGLQALTALFFTLGPIHKFRQILVAEQPTLRARSYIHPERDLPIYACGVPLILVAMFAACAAWQRAVRAVARRNGEADRTRFVQYGAFLQTFLAVASFAVFLMILAGRYPVTPGSGGFARTTESLGGGAILWLPALLACVCLAVDLRFATCGKSDESSRAPNRWTDRFFAAAVVLLIAGGIYIPASARVDLIGRVTMREWVHHWNFFAMGPALGYVNGRGIGDGTYAQYGVGWPLFTAQLARILPLTYANLLATGVTYGCIYYIGVFAFVRMWTGRTLWGAIGALLAVHWHLFSGVAPGMIQWLAPSSTLLRHPADIWFFMALLIAAQSDVPARRLWAIAATGLFAGLGLLFEIDTGVVLVGVFAVCLPLMKPTTTANRRWMLRDAGVFAIGFLVGCLPGLWIASRGHLLHAGFWSGWLEGLRRQGFTGFGMLPVAGVDDAGILLFLAMLAVYLLTITCSTAPAAASSAQRRDRTIAAAVSLYGLGLLLNFVGRSHSFNLYHAAVPLAILVVFWLSKLEGVSRSFVRFTSVPAALLGMVLALLVTAPEMKPYPSLIKGIFRRPPVRASIALIEVPRDLGGLPESERAFATDFKALVPRLRDLTADRSSVLILDSMDTTLYYATGLAPWSRYSSVLHMTQSRPMLRSLQKEIEDRRPRYVVLRAASPRDDGEFGEAEFKDLFEVLDPMIQKSHVLQERVGMFEIWKLR